VPHPRGGAVSRDVGDRAALAVLWIAWHSARRPAKRLGTVAGRWGDAWK
jgi:hypothetical protein